MAYAKWVDADPALSQIISDSDQETAPGVEAYAQVACALPVGGSLCAAIPGRTPGSARAVTDFGVNRVRVDTPAPVASEDSYSAQAISEWRDDFTYGGVVPGKVSFVFETSGSWDDGARFSAQFGAYYSFVDIEGTPFEGYSIQVTNCLDYQLDSCGFDPNDFSGDILIGDDPDNDAGTWSRQYVYTVQLNPLQQVTIGAIIDAAGGNGGDVDSFSSSYLRTIILEPGGSISSASGATYNVVVAEPSSFALLGVGAGALLGSLRARKQRSRR